MLESDVNSEVSVRKQFFQGMSGYGFYKLNPSDFYFPLRRRVICKNERVFFGLQKFFGGTKDLYSKKFMRGYFIYSPCRIGPGMDHLFNIGILVDDIDKFEKDHIEYDIKRSHNPKPL